MTISVQALHEFGSTIVPVKLDGFCLHHNTDMETNYSGYYSQEHEDYIEKEERLEVCLDCDAWRYPFDYQWHDEYMDDNYGIPARNNGRLVLK